MKTPCFGLSSFRAVVGLLLSFPVVAQGDQVVEVPVR